MPAGCYRAAATDGKERVMLGGIPDFMLQRLAEKGRGILRALVAYLDSQSSSIEVISIFHSISL